MHQSKQAEQTIDALTFRLLVAAQLNGAWEIKDVLTAAASLLEAIRAKEAEIGIGIRIEP